MRILFLTQRLPFAPNRGDRVRAFHLLNLLGRFAQVDVVSFVHDDEEAARASQMPAAATVRTLRVSPVRNHVLAVPALLGSTPLTHLLLRSPQESSTLALAAAAKPDVLLPFGSGMARFCVSPPLQHIPFVLDMVDADSAKWASLATTARFPMSWIYRREATLLGAFERTITARASSTTVVNDRERDVLRRIAPEGRLEVVPNGVDLDRLRPQDGPANSEDVVFCGVMNYPPNEEGAIWLATTIWPLVRRQHPTARLLLVGSNPTRRVQALASVEAGIVVTGSVPEVTPYLWGAAVSTAPLFTARGIQNKVLEAVAAGLPTIVTTPVAEGLPPDVLPACTVADEVESFAGAICTHLRLSPPERRAVAHRADLRTLGWDHCLAPFRGLLEEAAASRLR
jgi:sugar transferase (PEP-CTERM/EpsH1 system associated)